MNKTKHNQIKWISDGKEPKRTYRRMIVGWQNVDSALNVLIRSFNIEFLKVEKHQHQGMVEIAIKKQVLAALFEVQKRLNEWYGEMRKLGALSNESRTEKIRVRKIIAHAIKFKKIRNTTFHFGDMLEQTNRLLALYQQIDETDISLLNQIILDLRTLGECLKRDAQARCD